MPNNALESLFNPQSIAVVGVSTDATKLSSVIYKNVQDSDFGGALYPVNPKYPEINGSRSYSSVSEIEGEVDMAVVVIPAQFVMDTVKDCVSKGVKNCVIISAGFGETGKEGRELEDQILAIAKESGMRILGPNCLGLSVPRHNLDASFAATAPMPGNIAFISQSGAFNTAMLDMAARYKLGFSHFVSLGNKSDLNELDFVKAWMDDDKVQVIGMYIEEFADGRDLVELVAQIRKPVVILHPGESREAQDAIASHTGSLANSSEVVRAALRKAGAIQVDSIEKMFNALKGFSWSKPVSGEKVGILTNAGGPGIMVTDMVVANHISLPHFSDDLQAQLKQHLPDASSTINPVDLIGDAKADRYHAVLNELDKSSEIDFILVILTPQHVTQIEETAKAIIEYHQSGTKPVMAIFFGSERVWSGLELLNDAKVPAYEYAEEGIFVLGHLRKFAKHITLDPEPTQLPVERDHRLTEMATDESIALTQDMVHEIADGLSFDFPAEATVDSFQGAVNFVSEHDFPVVLKASTEDIAHKTDEKALYLNIVSNDELQRAFQELQETVKKVAGTDQPKLLIQQQISGGEELIIGITRDGGSDVYDSDGDGFGHLILVGKGGIYTEVYKDTATALTPVSRDQLRQMVMSTNVSKVLMGIRGAPPLALDKLIDTLEAAQLLVTKFPEIDQLDINPVILTKDRCIAVDMKVFIKK